MATTDLLDALTAIGEGVRMSTIERDDLIRTAVAAGISQREVARAVGLSHTAVQRIARQ